MLNPSPLILFVTGRLAESSLREVVGSLAERLGFRFLIAVPGIQVAALLHTGLLLKRLVVPPEVDRVIVPGWCQGDLNDLETHFGKPFERGPRDLFDLPEYFGVGKRKAVELNRYSIEIIAEINHATRLPLEQILADARNLSSAGANVIDVGGVPGESCNRVGTIVRALRDEGFRVSIDSFDRCEVEQAAAAGAELVLSCNHGNLDWIVQTGLEVVAIPDSPQDGESLGRLIDRLREAGVSFRVDPILEPIGMGFTASLERYWRTRQKYPDLPMMMGIGNVTELTEVDSAGVNMLLAGICEELRIGSVLTTQVINWCRSGVAEFDSARRQIHHAVSVKTIPKHLDSSLVMLRDPRLKSLPGDALRQLAAALTDANYRIFAEQGELHLMNSDGHWHGRDVFRLFEEAILARTTRPPFTRSSTSATDSDAIGATHAFYLGYELARAEIALHLGKQYTQDSPLRWGLLGDSSAAGHSADSPPPRPPIEG